MTAGAGPWDLVTRGGLDILALMALVGLLHRRGRPAPQMPLMLTALNIGLFAAMGAMSAGRFPAGVGFGLFGMLSLVRLRSAAFTAKDVAYTFVALVIALCSGLPQRETWFVVALDALMLGAVAVMDGPHVQQPVWVVKLTLDRLYANPGAIHQDVAFRFGQEPVAVLVDEVDYVRETTRVSVQYRTDRSVNWDVRDDGVSPDPAWFGMVESRPV
ncbi:DUF4956 domain-containing protein [Streptomyces sp. NPDC002619]|uniref:DUF4956 domain-containing protein n=1 Tax=Streptomyces sp. NPDC002619 TaxID=3364655 RepID=UPI00368DB10D